MNTKGLAGEEHISRLLTGAGFEILYRNFHSRYGEIDIIAAGFEYIVFVEVKTRGKNSIARPAEFVDIRKQEKIRKTALCFLAEHPVDLQPRFDVAEVFTDTNGDITGQNYIPNAF